MKLDDINIRDPFILAENGVLYLYGTRAENFGRATGGFDVYISKDMEEWSGPVCCFDSEAAGLNAGANWAPEVHKYKGEYYMFATFVQENALRGTYALKAASPEGPFQVYSDGALTPKEWECLDGTLFIDKGGTPYLVFCHEHTQIEDGSICFVQLREGLMSACEEPELIFYGSSAPWAEQKKEGVHFITDGPFLLRTKKEELFLLWSTFINKRYAQCVAKSDNGELNGNFQQLEPLFTEDGGHGMVFVWDGIPYLILHAPNRSGEEHLVIRQITEFETA